MIIVSLIVSFATALIAFFIGGKNIVVVSYGLVIPLVLLSPRFFYYFDSKVKKVVDFQWVKKIDFFAFFILLFNAPASLILHDLNFQYDRILHFSAAFFGSIIFSLLWIPVIKIKGEEIKKKKFLIFILVVSFIGLFLWEGLQYSIDQAFGTKLFFDPGQKILKDFSEDIIFGTIGLILALSYLDHSFKKFLGLCK